MKVGTLATLSQVKPWLNIPADNTTDDVLLQRLIDSASSFVYSFLNLDTFAKSRYDEMYDGHGGAFMVLRQEPTIDVLSLSINGTPIPAASGDGRSTQFNNGYVLLRQNLVLYGYLFPRCRNSVFVSYEAGYAMSSEMHTVPSGNTVQTNETFLDDHGVTINGVALAVVPGTPGPMQYSVTDGLYTFNAAQDGATVALSYSYCPADINQAVVEMVGERYRYKDHIGVRNKTLQGNETVGYSANSVPQYVKDMLNKYIRVVPA